MKTVLFVCTFGDFLPSFEMDNIKRYQQMGYFVVAASNFSDEKYNKKTQILINEGVALVNVPFRRSPFGIAIFKNTRKLKAIIRKYKPDVVDCHNPVCGIIARKAASTCGVPKIVYTCHGFHFYRGAPFINWAFFFPLEKRWSKVCDLIITINKEDYSLAKKEFKAKNTVYVPGVGMDYSFFKDHRISVEEKRAELSIPQDSFLLLSVGELNKNKNHETVIKSLSYIDNEKVHYAVAGAGSRLTELEDLAKKLHVEKRVHFLGYRTDTADLYKACDVYVLPSFREGLNVSVMEAMSAGLPCIVSRIRGNVDMIDNNGGRLCDPRRPEEFAEAIKDLLSTDLSPLGTYNQGKAAMFDKSNVKKEFDKAYGTIL